MPGCQGAELLCCRRSSAALHGDSDLPNEPPRKEGKRRANSPGRGAAVAGNRIRAVPSLGDFFFHSFIIYLFIYCHINLEVWLHNEPGSGKNAKDLLVNHSVDC